MSMNKHRLSWLFFFLPRAVQLLFVLSCESFNKTNSQAVLMQRWVQQIVMTIFSSLTVAGFSGGGREEKESCVWEPRASLASLKAISICIMNGTSCFQLANLWSFVLGGSSLATVSKLTGNEC